jgi:hypothetical protein
VLKRKLMQQVESSWISESDDLASEQTSAASELSAKMAPSRRREAERMCTLPAATIGVVGV